MAFNFDRDRGLINMDATGQSTAVANVTTQNILLDYVVFINGGTAGNFTIQDENGVQIGMPIAVPANYSFQIFYNKIVAGIKWSAGPAGAVGIMASYKTSRA